MTARKKTTKKAERDDHGAILHIRASKVGENGVKPDTWMTLRGGEFVEVTEAS